MGRAARSRDRLRAVHRGVRDGNDADRHPGRRILAKPLSFGTICPACYNVDMDPIVTANPKIMHGVPCFAGTRVAVQTLFDHLEAGYDVDEFLEPFPTVKREQVIGLLEQSKREAEKRAVMVGS